jgi:hypothetical protein
MNNVGEWSDGKEKYEFTLDFVRTNEKMVAACKGL